MMEYAENRLKSLGEGSSRRVFLLSSRFVLKIAKDDFGISQNEEEAKASRDPKVNHVLAKVQSSDAKNMWLVSELVRPVKDDAEAMSILSSSEKTDLTFSQTLRRAFRGQFEGVSSKNIQDFMRTVHTLVKGGHDEGDIFALDHWGKTNDGRLVLLDYGYTSDAQKKYFD